MAIFDDFWTWAFDQLNDLGAVDDAADQGYDLAMSMCGNEGQVSIIDMMGYDAFHDAAAAAAEGTGQGYDILVSACPYPEAVEFILQEAMGLILDIINDNLTTVIGELREDQQGEGEDAGDDSWWD